MRSEIVEKLKKYSHEYPKEEAHVTYLVVQIGKIIERENADKDFPVLWFYRNWVVHYQLDKKGRDGRMEMLDMLNDAIRSIDSDRTKMVEQFGEAVSLKRLHLEIASFFKANGLEKDGLNYLSWFKHFDELLVKILIDLPLLPPQDRHYIFKEFRFKKSNDGDGFGFEIKLNGNAFLGGRAVVKVNAEFTLDDPM